MGKVNIVCIKWGDKFDSGYVNKLYNMVERNITLPFRFWCITDDSKGIQEQVSIRKLPSFIVERIKGRYKKLIMFDNEIWCFEGTVLYIDLNTLIFENIDCFFEYKPKEFIIIKNWLQAPGNGKFSSGLMRFESGFGKILWDKFLEERPDMNGDCHHNKHWNVHDQGWISCEFPDLETWPEGWVASYKYCCEMNPQHKREKAKKAKIISFHGKPNLHEVNDDWVKECWR